MCRDVATTMGRGTKEILNEGGVCGDEAIQVSEALSDKTCDGDGCEDVTTQKGVTSNRKCM